MRQASSFNPGGANVLIIGGGLAALMAALAVLEEGGKPAVISAAPVGKSGNTMMANGVISGVTNEGGNTPEAFAHDLAASGKGLADPGLIERMAEDSSAMLDVLVRYGVPLKKANGSFEYHMTPGHSVPRNIPADWTGVPSKIRGSVYLTAPLAYLEKSGVPMDGSMRAGEIVLDDAGVAGVLAYDRKAGKTRFLPFRRVVIATGGFGGIFMRHNNVSGMVGDGAALALKAGAALRDMEMVQFFPTMMFEPVKMTITNGVFGAGAVVRNSDGERFLSRYDPAGDMATRDSMARAIFLEVQAGRGIDGCAWVDLTAIPRDVLDKQFAFFEVLKKHGVDVAKDWLKGTPCAHYTLGGVRVDPDGRTGIPGLYAAGEVTGGVHGVNRLGGAALMEVALFGRHAGLAAASDAVPAGTGGGAVPEDAGYGDEEDRDDDFRALRGLMWEYASLTRDEAGLTRALELLHGLKEKERARCASGRSFFSGTLAVAESVIRSALARTESRGAHYRTDFPETDPAQARPLLASLRDSRITVSAQGA